jgi:Mg-chelatase subunit ChlD
MTTNRITHVYFLLDRSGSMGSMASDVIGGFNQFLKEQQADGGDALMTVVQFDTEDPHQVLASALPIANVPQLDATTFRPRGGTPLYDAMGQLIADATIRQEIEGDKEVIIFVTFTDGQENASENYSDAMIRTLIANREAKGWTFVYMGANQDSYRESGRIGFSADNIQDFEGSGRGATMAFASMSKGMAKERGKIRMGAVRDVQGFFEGDKEAEDDLRNRP